VGDREPSCYRFEFGDFLTSFRTSRASAKFTFAEKKQADVRQVDVRNVLLFGGIMKAISTAKSRYDPGGVSRDSRRRW